MYFLGIWGGSKAGITKLKAKLRNYLWIGEDRPYRARIAWHTCCLCRKEGGLGRLALVDPADAMTALMSKWVLCALELRDSNLKAMLQRRLYRLIFWCITFGLTIYVHMFCSAKSVKSTMIVFKLPDFNCVTKSCS
jgi:hypothetical protein